MILLLFLEASYCINLMVPVTLIPSQCSVLVHQTECPMLASMCQKRVPSGLHGWQARYPPVPPLAFMSAACHRL